MFDTIRYKMAKKLILEFAPHIPVGNIKLTFPEGDVHEFKGKKRGRIGRFTYHLAKWSVAYHQRWKDGILRGLYGRGSRITNACQFNRIRRHK